MLDAMPVVLFFLHFFCFLFPASPPRFVTFEQLMSAADDMKNMTLAHEIAVNNDFELPKEQAPQNRCDRYIYIYSLLLKLFT